MKHCNLLKEQDLLEYNKIAKSFIQHGFIETNQELLDKISQMNVNGFAIENPGL